MSALTAVAIGAGERGHHTFGRWALSNPDELRYIGVVDPDPSRRQRFSKPHQIPESRRFAGIEELFARERLADCAVISAPDRTHFAAAVAALQTGYHVLLEKPMAATLQDSVELVRLSEASDRIVQVAHVLRYTPFFRTLNDVLTSDRLGDLVTVEHRENVSAAHMAHSFVRGNWSTTATSTPMIVQKCSHDFDILSWNLDSPVARLSSIGSLLHFTPDNQPEGATERCTDGCPVTDCPFDARRMYLTDQVGGWPIHVITDDYSMDGRLKALRDGPYGRCVYTAGSDVVDHQVVTMELESGASCVLVSHGHSHQEGRTMRYDGTRATLRATTAPVPMIEITDHRGGMTEQLAIPRAVGSHGGGDRGLLGTFIDAVNNGGAVPTSPTVSLESHYLAFAAEQARVERTTIEMSDWRASFTH